MQNGRNTSRGFLVLGYAVTPLHPGTGRAPGLVDLPVQRDPFGYPIVFASSVKGAFKAECARRADKGGGCFNGEGRIRCRDGSEKCRLCCCLFGHEPGSDQAASLLSVLDLIPLFIPVPSLSHGYLYMTTPYLARRALGIMEALGLEELAGIRRLLGEMAEAGSDFSGCIDGEVYVATERIGAPDREIKALIGCEELEEIAGLLGGLAKIVSSRLLVVPDKYGSTYLEKSLVRITRIRLRLDTKTASRGALWTEEYIPQGTVFLGGFIATLPKRNIYCSDGLVDENVLEEKMKDFMDIMSDTSCTAYSIMGGKETIGRGLMKLRLIPCAKREVGQP